MECIELVCHTLLEPGDAVAVEAPTYLGAMMAFAGSEAASPASRWTRTACWSTRSRRGSPAATARSSSTSIPEYQNPSGRTLALERREALIELCRRHGVLILEDVAYREISFDGAALPSLWSLAPEACCRPARSRRSSPPASGSAGRSGPRDVIAQMAAAKQTTDQCASGSASGWSRVRPRRRLRAPDPAQPRAVRLALAGGRAGAPADLPDGCTWSEPTGGFFTWLTLPSGLDAGEMRAAPWRRRHLRPRPAFYAGDDGRNEMRLSFSHLSEEELDRAVERLAGVIRGRLDAAG